MADPSPNLNPSHSANAALRGFGTRTALRLGGIWAVLVLLGLGFWIYQAAVGTSAAGGVAYSIDFRVFWAAARLALAGEAVAGFDITQLEEVHQIRNGEWLPWVYPPTFLMVLEPLGQLDFFAAWALFAVLSILLMGTALYQIARGYPAIWIGFTLAPAMWPVLMLGQVAMIWGAGLVAGLAALQARRPVLAGVFFGLLTFKPQLGLLIPVALLASREWRCFASAAVTAVIFAGMATLTFGPEYWPAMRLAIAEHFGVVRELIPEGNLMISPYSALVGLGLSEGPALTLQWSLTLLAALAVFWAWRDPRVSADIRAALLITAIPLTSPYLWYTEAALLVPALVFLLRGGALRGNALALILGAAILCGPGPLTVAQLFLEDTRLSIRLFMAPVILASFAIALLAVMNRQKALPPNR